MVVVVVVRQPRERIRCLKRPDRSPVQRNSSGVGDDLNIGDAAVLRDRKGDDGPSSQMTEACGFGYERIPVDPHTVDNLVHIGAEIVPAGIGKDRWLFGREVRQRLKAVVHSRATPSR